MTMRDTTGLAKHFREASGAGTKKMRRLRTPRVLWTKCDLCRSYYIPGQAHLCHGERRAHGECVKDAKEG